MDYINDDNENIEFDSYMIGEDDLEDGALRMLEVDNRVILPEYTHIRFILTAADVIHSFAVPALALKCDAYPGRLNQLRFCSTLATQQSQMKLDPHWITGFVDGEGCSKIKGIKNWLKGSSSILNKS